MSDDDDALNQEPSAPDENDLQASPLSLCGNGHELGPGENFCAQCGLPRAAVDLPPSTPSTPQPAKEGPKRSVLTWAVVAVIVVVIAVVASATLLSHKSVSTIGGDNTAQLTWSSGQQIDATDTGLAISCPVADFCVAVGTDGYEFTYSGDSWSNGNQIDTNDISGFSSVSCPTTTFCVAVDGNSEFTYSGGVWSDGQKIDTNTGSAGPFGLISISCPAITFCVAMDFGGSEFTYSGGTWSSGQKIDANTDSIGGKSLGIIGIHVSCPTVDFCVAVDADGYEFTYSGGTWSSGKQISSGLITVSCVTANFCIAAGGSYGFTYSSGTWSNGDEVGTRMNANGLIGLESVSCATTSFCVVVGGEGRELTYSGGAWSSSKQIDNNLSAKVTHFPLLYVSCPTASFCAATDANGFVFIAKGSGQKTASTTTVPMPTATTPGSTVPALPTITIAGWSGRDPDMIYFSGDAGNVVTGITWSVWNQTEAVGHGVRNELGCVPNCAQGTATPYPVTLTLTTPVAGNFTSLEEQTADGKGTTQTFLAPYLGQGACATSSEDSCVFAKG